MSQDITECQQVLDDLRQNYSRSPTTTPRVIRNNIELTLNNESDDSDDASQDTIRRISVVEECIYEVLHLEAGGMKGQLRKVSVSPLAHVPAYALADQQWAWPQGPLMVRPTPYSSTKILGIRRAGSTEYEHFAGFCAGCILPIINGKEEKGNSLVVDFESKYFVGTLLLRIKQAKEVDGTEYGEESYFDGKKRKFQAVVRGRFKSQLSMSQCVTGQAFDRPAGKLPNRWLVNAFIKFISTLAPQLEATLDGEKPRFLSPLVATAHTVLVSHANNTIVSEDMETGIEEPASTDATSVMSKVSNDIVAVPDTTTASVGSRMKARKKVFNTLTAKDAMEPRFDTDKEYTFEFYQHLLDFGDELAVDMGRIGGKVGLAAPTDGQPLKVMGAYRNPDTHSLEDLWSFDLWHASLYPYAKAADVERS
ncbi:MAG: hypothetical protein SGARI_000872 [Bacillariaceae sp.]